MSRDRIEELIARERWTEARRVIRQELKEDAEDHWLLTRLSTTHYEERNYKKALAWVEKARALAPDCPLVLWDYAGTLEMLGRPNEAGEVYLHLLSRGIDYVANEECGEGAAWAAALLSDCVYRVAGCQEAIGHPGRAVKLYHKHLQLRDLGAGSIYDRDEVEERIRKLSRPRRESMTDILDEVEKELAATD